YAAVRAAGARLLATTGPGSHLTGSGAFPDGAFADRTPAAPACGAAQGRPTRRRPLEPAGH
ncbi:hypothetical protein, partial [Nonomuraea sp. NPDC005501]|uniref:hypothetical protein n=1 Tax=Nonomuraea sp. NPDC005501 TaxID=3156884 RepID=UPI0033A74AD7